MTLTKEQTTNRNWLIIAFIVGILVTGVACYRAYNGELSSWSSSPTPPSEIHYPKLELEASEGSRGYGYIEITGLVKNITDEPLRGVAAVVIMYDKNGKFITNDDAMIDYDPLLAGQTSPFKVMVRDNPAMARWEIQFKTMLGGQIETMKKGGT